MAIAAILLGAVLGGGYIALIRRDEERMPGLLALGLFIAALIYAGFAVAGGASADAILVEFAGVIIFGFLAWSGANRHLSYVALGWLVHVAWDVALHVGETAGAGYTPGWYPWLCVGFDLLVAGWAAREAGLLGSIGRK